MDEKFRKLAKVLSGHSTRLKRGEHVLVDLWETPLEMAEALAVEIRARGAHPHFRLNDSRLSRLLALSGGGERLSVDAEIAMETIRRMDAYIAVRGSGNSFENSDVPASRMAEIAKAMKPSVDWRVNKTKWVVLRWPTPAMAQLARMSTSRFEEIFFRVCCMDYSKMASAMKPLVSLMNRTDSVEIRGNGTDLRFSIKGMRAIPCAGQYNIPDGEVFTAPVLDSVEGAVRYNVPTIYNGSAFDSVELEFSRGRIVRASSPSNSSELKKILSSDDGASRIGEFALGVNPFISEPMRDILFDEKISGSFHFTPGQAYCEADNGNRSRIHWDMVCVQTKERGGGEIYFDGKLVRKDGLFVPKNLRALNPENF